MRLHSASGFVVCSMLVVLASSSGCAPAVVCGDGTVERDGACVVAASACAAGTVLQEGECVPDGSVICTGATAYDAATGTCVPDEDACGEGTVFAAGECVAPDATLVADATEGAEPNGLYLPAPYAGTIPVPAAGERGYVIHGCITPREEFDGNPGVEPDYDRWQLTVEGPTLLEITADGVGGLAAAFLVQTQVEDLVTGWRREGINLTGDRSSRQIYLPAAGNYPLVMMDGRTRLANNVPAGNEDTCYFTTVRQLPIPQPTPISAGVTEGSTSGEVKFYSVEGLGDGSILRATLTTPSQSAQGVLMLLRNGALVTSVNELANNVHAVELVRGGQLPSDAVTLVVDGVRNVAFEPADFTLEVLVREVAPLPADGTEISLSQSGAQASLASRAYTRIDVDQPDSLVHLDLGLDTAGQVEVWDVTHRAPLASFAAGTAVKEWIRFQEPGRYYVSFFVPDAETAQLQVTSTVVQVQPTPLTLGTAAVDVPVTPQNGAWFLIDDPEVRWFELETTPSGFEGDVELRAYAPQLYGHLGPAFRDQRILTSGSAPSSSGLLLPSFSEGLLLRVSDAEGSGDGTHTVTLRATERVHTEVILIADGLPVSYEGEAPAGPSYFLVRSALARTPWITVHPEGAGDFSLQLLSLIEEVTASVDAAGAGGTESLQASVDPRDEFVGVAVVNKGAGPVGFTLQVSAVAP